jgi:hypothetical protein
MKPFLDRSAGTIGGFACIWGDSQMKLTLQLLACWLAFSCIFGPLFSWAFFRGERLARDGGARKIEGYADATSANTAIMARSS